MKKDYEIESIEIGDFRVLHIFSNPPRIEAKVVFDRDDISQKFIFTLMEISHLHGFGCSPPFFSDTDSTMTFLIGTILPSKKSFNKYQNRIVDCLARIHLFSKEFQKQLDFSMLDVSMFTNVNLDDFSPQNLVAIKDQVYDGDWDKYYQDMIDENRSEDAELIQKCMVFEETNKKDIGLVGHKLSYMLHMLDQFPLKNSN
jgi:hypothetical protein